MNVIDINQELSQNFLDFSYEANVQRAFPDARDGLKPGQRACLWEMYDKKYTNNKPHVKSAKISGGVIANWWPHGETAVYDTFARMSQKWINNLPEVDWHGANGSIQVSNEPAASRYTEAKLAKSSEEGLLNNINKNNIPMQLNFSEDAEWPEVLPAIYPRLLVNGCQGIGSTIANVWLPHNLQELTVIITNYVSTGILDLANLAPDFPTGGIIINKDNVANIYTTGKGKVVVRAKTQVEGNLILITEIPYQVYVEPLIDQIKELITNDTLSGIEDVTNKSDRTRLLIEVKCEKNPNQVLFELFKNTDLQKSYSANQFALIGKTPELLTLREYLDVFIDHVLLCIQKEFEYDLKKAQDRIAIVDGLLKALEDIDNIITLIKQSDSPTHAIQQLIQVYDFTERQAKAVVDMKLGRLAKLEKIELEKEKAELTQTITNCLMVINDVTKRQTIFLDRLSKFSKKYGSPRKTELLQLIEPKTSEEKRIANIPPEKVVVVLTKAGNIKRISADKFRTQRRAGKGIKTQDDITSMILRTNTIDSLMIFTNKGNMYRLVVDDIPEGTNTSTGVPVKALVSMNAEEEPSVIYSIYYDTEAKYVLFVTKQGYVKRTALDEYTGIKRKTGIKALNLHDGDSLATVFLTNDEEILLLSQNGYAIRCKSTEFPVSSRVSMGYKGINLKPEDTVLTALPIRSSTDDIAFFSHNGLGRRVALKSFTLQARNGRGSLYAKDVNTAAACTIANGDMILICGDVSSICIKADELPTTASKDTQGIIILKGNTKITGVSKV